MRQARELRTKKKSRNLEKPCMRLLRIAPKAMIEAAV
jgi:hypothetical protein